jgi:hypothetical protein
VRAPVTAPPAVLLPLIAEQYGVGGRQLWARGMAARLGRQQIADSSVARVDPWSSYWHAGTCLCPLGHAVPLIGLPADTQLAYPARQPTQAKPVLQLPRPRWLETSTRFGAYWMSSPSGVVLRRFALAVHGFVIARQAS